MDAARTAGVITGTSSTTLGGQSRRTEMTVSRQRWHYWQTGRRAVPGAGCWGWVRSIDGTGTHCCPLHRVEGGDTRDDGATPGNRKQGAVNTEH
jgi:hypothetical protein